MERCPICEEEGLFHCRVCKKYFCTLHKCSHLPEFNISFDNLGENFDDDETNIKDKEKEENPFIGFSSTYLSTPLLRKRIDSLFRELKTLQKELDCRAISSDEVQDYTSRFNTKPRPRKTGFSITPRLKPEIKESRKLKEAIEFFKAKGLLDQLVEFTKRKKE